MALVLCSLAINSTVTYLVASIAFPTGVENLTFEQIVHVQSLRIPTNILPVVP